MHSNQRHLPVGLEQMCDVRYVDMIYENTEGVEKIQYLIIYHTPIMNPVMHQITRLCHHHVHQ